MEDCEKIVKARWVCALSRILARFQLPLDDKSLDPRYVAEIFHPKGIIVPTAKRHLPMMLPLCLLFSATAVLRMTDLDTAICGLFFGGQGIWPAATAQPFQFIYEFGTYPGWILGACGCLLWLIGLLGDKRLARQGFFCMMVVLLGPGLLVNALLKPNMNRPRPCQITRFQGDAQFQPVLNIGPQQEDLVCRSFPSGHASMGFSLIAVPLLLRHRRRLFVVSVGLAIGAGLLVGMTRIVQGRHYPSDVLWSGAIVYCVAVCLYYATGLHQCRDSEEDTRLTRTFAADGQLISVPFESPSRSSDANTNQNKDVDRQMAA